MIDDLVKLEIIICCKIEVCFAQRLLVCGTLKLASIIFITLKPTFEAKKNN